MSPNQLSGHFGKKGHENANPGSLASRLLIDVGLYCQLCLWRFGHVHISSDRASCLWNIKHFQCTARRCTFHVFFHRYYAAPSSSLPFVGQFQVKRQRLKLSDASKANRLLSVRVTSTSRVVCRVWLIVRPRAGDACTFTVVKKRSSLVYLLLRFCLTPLPRRSLDCLLLLLPPPASRISGQLRVSTNAALFLERS